MHSAGLEFTNLTYTRLEDNPIRHRGDWFSCRLLCSLRWHKHAHTYAHLLRWLSLEWSPSAYCPTYQRSSALNCRQENQLLRIDPCTDLWYYDQKVKATNFEFEDVSTSPTELPLKSYSKYIYCIFIYGTSFCFVMDFFSFQAEIFLVFCVFFRILNEKRVAAVAHGKTHGKCRGHRVRMCCAGRWWIFRVSQQSTQYSVLAKKENKKIAYG